MSDRALDGLGPEHVRAIVADEALMRAQAALGEAGAAVDAAWREHAAAWDALSADDAQDLTLVLRHLANVEAQA